MGVDSKMWFPSRLSIVSGACWMLASTTAKEDRKVLTTMKRPLLGSSSASTRTRQIDKCDSDSLARRDRCMPSLGLRPLTSDEASILQSEGQV